MSLKHPMLNVFGQTMEDNSLESVEWIPVEPDSFQAGTDQQRFEITHKAISNFVNLHRSYVEVKLKIVDNKYIITNGPAFINEKNFYHTDTKKRIIYKIKIDKNLNILEKKIFKKFLGVEGFPDGMTTDRFKNLWVCHFGGSSISVFNQKGKKIYKIKLPAKNVTNCAFGGANNNDLYITTALKGLKEIDKKKYNLSGSLFKVRTNSKGMTSKSFNVIYD